MIVASPIPLIELRQVYKTFGNQTVLRGVNLQIFEGDRLAVIGPSGTGKSTILRVIAGLLMPDQGEVLLKGVARRSLIEDADDPFHISLVFQQAALFDSLTVAENIGFYLYQHSRLSRQRIYQLVGESLEKVGLSDIRNLYPAELSGGMRKRVSFARAIIADPDSTEQKQTGIILYDEPTAGLDPIASTIIEDLMRNLGCKDATGCDSYLVVTHQESTIRRTAERVVMLYGGQVVWLGQVDELDESDNPYVRQFFNASVEGPIQAVH
ncbi:MAG: ATP-binding cassette domain-containing protein [Synechococcales cyanobacterium CRU_2_2]|nr:ATP-binding cassette domain-containing protein [Synechococcales cyanobacterium CRU_2_2]